MYTESETRQLGSKLFDVVAEMLRRDIREDKNLCYSETCPFDIQPANFHANKSEFTSERRFLEKWLEDIESWISVLQQPSYARPEDQDMHLLVDYLNGWARSNSKLSAPSTAIELAANNLLRVGMVAGLVSVLNEVMPIIEQRLELLEKQETDYWSVSHRPPNYHARIIALRLARLYADEVRTCPTIGVSGDTGGPSTAYGRALERCFEVLNIHADFRSAGEWAVSCIANGSATHSQDEERRTDPVEVLNQIWSTGYLRKPPEI